MLTNRRPFVCFSSRSIGSSRVSWIRCFRKTIFYQKSFPWLVYNLMIGVWISLRKRHAKSILDNQSRAFKSVNSKLFSLKLELKAAVWNPPLNGPISTSLLGIFVNHWLAFPIWQSKIVSKFNAKILIASCSNEKHFSTSEKVSLV